jgi:hypothetical protein
MISSVCYLVDHSTHRALRKRRIVGPGSTPTLVPMIASSRWYHWRRDGASVFAANAIIHRPVIRW